MSPAVKEFERPLKWSECIWDRKKVRIEKFWFLSEYLKSSMITLEHFSLIIKYLMFYNGAIQRGLWLDTLVEAVGVA